MEGMTEKQKQLALLAVIAGMLLMAVGTGTLPIAAAAVVIGWVLIIGAAMEWFSRRRGSGEPPA